MIPQVLRKGEREKENKKNQIKNENTNYKLQNPKQINKYSDHGTIGKRRT